MIPTREEILKILRENKARLVEKYGLTKLGLFGAVNYGVIAANDVDAFLLNSSEPQS